jgi:hypothetical protein
MNEESRLAGRLPTRNSVGREVSTHYGRRDREHELDRMVVAAVWRRDQAKAGHGFKFEAPKQRAAA